MRFIEKEPESHPDGQTKTKTWFALEPIKIGKETRWLEVVTVEFEWFEGYGAYAAAEWIAKRFI